LLNKSPEMVHVDQEVFDRLPISNHSGGDVFPFNTRRTAIFSLVRIKRDLDFRSTPFTAWMLKTIEWFTQNQTDHSFGYENREWEIQYLSKYREGGKAAHSNFFDIA